MPHERLRIRPAAVIPAPYRTLDSCTFGYIFRVLTEPYPSISVPAMAKKKKVIHRSAIDGKFVTPEYADKHPKTTEREHVSVGKPSK
jgi:hypothetical protein